MSKPSDEALRAAREWFDSMPSGLKYFYDKWQDERVLAIGAHALDTYARQYAAGVLGRAAERLEEGHMESELIPDYLRALADEFLDDKPIVANTARVAAYQDEASEETRVSYRQGEEPERE